MRPSAVAVEVSAAGVIPGSARGQSTIRTGDLIVDVKTQVVSIGDKPAQLTEKEYRIIELLSLRKGAAATREMLLGHLYGGINKPELKIIDVFVSHLRKKLALATDGKHYIKTVWGRGFLLRNPMKYRG
jgi:two-component system cell cycle response regulator CtrA